MKKRFIRKSKELKEKEELVRYINSLEHELNYSFKYLNHRYIFFEVYELNQRLSKTRDPRICFLARAAYFRHAGLYNESLDNIQLASGLRAPANLVTQMREYCSSQMNMQPQNKPPKFFKLSYEANKKLPCLAECLELDENLNFGRHIITNRDLKAGDIVGITEPFFKAFCYDSRYYRCSYCFKENNMSLIPCSSCSKALFCSEECLITARKEYHEIECLSFRTSNPIDLSHCLPLKMLLFAIRIFGGVERMKNFMSKDVGKRDWTVFDYDLSDSNELGYEKKLLLATMSLKNTAADGEDMSFELKGIHTFIENVPRIKKLWTDENGKFLDVMLCKMIELSSLSLMHVYWSSDNYAHQTNTLMPNTLLSSQALNVTVHKIGDGIDPYATLMNGSCCANIRLVNVDNKNAWVVAYPIKAGEQLFRSYGEEFTVGPSAKDRQLLLNTHYDYICGCQACMNDFPEAQNLALADNDFKYDDRDEPLLDVKTAKEKFLKNCSYINENFHKNFPSKEICYAMSMNMFKLAALAKSEFYQ